MTRAPRVKPAVYGGYCSLPHSTRRYRRPKTVQDIRSAGYRLRPVVRLRLGHHAEQAAVLMMMWSLVSSDVGLTYYGQTVTNACPWFNVALRPEKP